MNKITKDEALKLALEAYIAAGFGNSTDFELQRKAHDLAIEALAEQPAKQQAGHTFYDGNGNVVAHLDATAEITMDYSKPSAWAQRKPLTDEQKTRMWQKEHEKESRRAAFDWYFQGIADSEAAHGIMSVSDGKGDA